uniref:Coiled-coil domain-containing protein 86 n=1 Tax=Balaenoptera musculus TaxID=9771 RepID=A0A8C0D3X1_BALMU
MDMPRRRSRRLEGLKPESPENPTSVLRARRALVELESNPEEKREPGSPRRVRPPSLGSPRHQPETSQRYPVNGRGQAWGPPESGQSRAQGPPSVSETQAWSRPQRQPESSPESLRPQPKPSGESPKFSQDQEEADSELPKSKEEPRSGSPRHQLQPGPGPPEPYPEPGSPGDRREPSKPPPAGQLERDGLGPEKREGSSAQAPASKKPKKEEEVPKVPKGKPRSGRGWKDRSKKSVSQMVQDKALRTSWPRKMQDRQETELAKDFARHLEEEKEQRRQEKHQRCAENPKRRPENERKAEIVQAPRNPRAKQQQLRSAEKRSGTHLPTHTPPQRLFWVPLHPPDPVTQETESSSAPLFNT